MLRDVVVVVSVVLLVGSLSRSLAKRSRGWRVVINGSMMVMMWNKDKQTGMTVSFMVKIMGRRWRSERCWFEDDV
jgi:hypothetical protein